MLLGACIDKLYITSVGVAINAATAPVDTLAKALFIML